MKLQTRLEAVKLQAHIYVLQNVAGFDIIIAGGRYYFFWDSKNEYIAKHYGITLRECDGVWKIGGTGTVIDDRRFSSPKKAIAWLILHWCPIVNSQGEKIYE